MRRLHRKDAGCELLHRGIIPFDDSNVREVLERTNVRRVELDRSLERCARLSRRTTSICIVRQLEVSDVIPRLYIVGPVAED